MGAKPLRADAIWLSTTAYILQGAPDPSAGAGVNAPVTSVYFQLAGTAQPFTLWEKVGTGDTAWVPLLARDMFGDASDGDLVVAGGTTPARDSYYGDLTIQNGGTFTQRFRTYVRGTLTVDVGGLITQDGSDGGAGGSAGAGAPSAVSSIAAAGLAGGAGGVGAGSGGSNSASCIQGFTGAGGAGGAGSGGAGGAAGTVTATAASAQGNPRSLSHGQIGQVGGNAVARFSAGAGGGGGGGDGTAGGGGGGGAGVQLIFAKKIVNNGTIRARGGAGGTPAAGNRGGGGGGGGGLIILGFHAFSGTAPSVAGGAKGLKSGTGVDGSDGTAGIYVPLQL